MLLCRLQKQTTAAATARWKANADVALAILWVRGLLTPDVSQKESPDVNLSTLECIVKSSFGSKVNKES